MAPLAVAAASLAAAGPALAAGALASGVGTILSLLLMFLNFYQFALFIRILLTWIPNVDMSSAPLQFLARITDPLLNGTRGLLPPIFGLDFGPTLVLIALNYITDSVQAAVNTMAYF
jgi:YggT family protein